MEEEKEKKRRQIRGGFGVGGGDNGDTTTRRRMEGRWLKNKGKRKGRKRLNCIFHQQLKFVNNYQQIFSDEYL